MSDNTEKNRSHWDEHASTYNSKFEKTIQQLIEEIQARKDWIGVDWVEEDSDDDKSPSTSISTNATPKKTVKLLDYACGTGLVSRALAPYTTRSIGIDLSSGMVSQYNLTASNQGLSPSEMQAYVGNLIPTSGGGGMSDENISGPDFFDFDIAAVGLGFHHFDDPGLAAKKLGERLKVGGTLLIIDFLPHKGFEGHGHSHGSQSQGHSHGNHSHGSHSHGHGHSHGTEGGKSYPEKAGETITHNGFSEADMKKMFEDAGVGEGFEYISVGKGVVFTMSKAVENGKDFSRSIFMAKGRKA